MPVIAKEGKKMSLSGKLSRLAMRLRDPEWRRYGGLLLGGKAMGIGLVLLIITVVSGVFFGHVYAQTATPEVKAADVVNPVPAFAAFSSTPSVLPSCLLTATDSSAITGSSCKTRQLPMKRPA